MWTRRLSGWIKGVVKNTARFYTKVYCHWDYNTLK